MPTNCDFYVTFDTTEQQFAVDFESTVISGDGFVLPPPITLEQYNAIVNKDSTAYYFIEG